MVVALLDCRKPFPPYAKKHEQELLYGPTGTRRVWEGEART